MDYIDNLIEYGLTRQEAVIYIEILKHGAMTGYEVSKETGISKSNVYSALKGLTLKGAAVCEEREATNYLPVDVKLFCDNHLRYLNERKEELIKNQPKQVTQVDGYITIASARNIYNKIYEMLEGCKYRLYIMADVKVIETFKDKLVQLADEKKKIVILAKKDLKLPGTIFYKVNNCQDQIRFIVDSDCVLTGTLKGGTEDTCVYSGQENLVNLVKETINNKMLLAEK